MTIPNKFRNITQAKRWAKFVADAGVLEPDSLTLVRIRSTPVGKRQVRNMPPSKRRQHKATVFRECEALASRFPHIWTAFCARERIAGNKFPSEPEPKVWSGGKDE